MNNKFKRIMSTILAVIMIIFAVPIEVFATGVVFRGTANKSIVAETPFNLMEGVTAAQTGTELNIKITDITAKGDDNFSFTEGTTSIENPVAGATYKITYSAYDKADTEYSSPLDTDIRTIKSVALTLHVNAVNAVVRSNTEFDMLKEITLTVKPEGESDNYNFRVKEVTSNNATFTWDGTSTTFVSGNEGDIYTITYVVTDDNGDVDNTDSVRTVTVSDTVGSDYIEKVTTDDVYLTNFEVTITEDGTAPFDANDEPGNDSSKLNGIVRSFDKVSYDMAASYNTYTNGKYYESGKIWYKVVLPYADQEAQFDTNSMPWMDEGWKVTVDPETGHQELLCSRTLKTSEQNLASIPGSNILSMVIKVMAMPNGSILQPTFYAWMDQNDTENLICPTHNVVEVKEVEADSVTVTAVLRLNANVVSSLNHDGSTLEYDFSTGNDLAINKDMGVVRGRLRGYGIVLQLMNANNNGLRGIELPSGPISITLDVDNLFASTANGNIRSPENYRPILWSYGGNSSKKNDDGRIVGGNACIYGVPLNYKGAGAVRVQECYDGGTWTASEQIDGQITFTINDYKIDLNQFPQTNAGSGYAYSHYNEKNDPTLSNKYIGCFSAAEIFILQPVNNLSTGEYIVDDEGFGAGQFQMTVEIGNLEAKSITGQEPQGISDTDTITNLSNKNQQNLSGDRISNTFALSISGNYGVYLNYTKYNSGSNGVDINGTGACGGNGKDTILVGGKLSLYGGSFIGISSESDNVPYGVNNLLKFNGTAIELLDEPPKFSDTNSGMETHVFYGTLPNGKDWVDDNQMRSTEEDGLIWYSSIKDIPEGHLCVAVLREMRGKGPRINQFLPRLLVNAKIRNDYSLVNMTQMLCITSKVWVYKDIASKLNSDPSYTIPSVMDTVNFENDYPKPVSKFVPTYERSYYDAGGFAGGDIGKGGDTLLIVPYKMNIQKEIAQTSLDRSGKRIYELDYGERVVDYMLTPSITTPELEYEAGGTDNTTTVTITDTLPAGLTYIPLTSFYGGTYTQDPKFRSPGTNAGGKPIEPVSVIKNDDGTTSLTWEIENVKIKAGELPKFYYSCLIGDANDPINDVMNNDTFVNTVTISSTEDKRLFHELEGNLDSTDIKVSKNVQLSLSKISKDKFYELSEDVGFVINYGNSGENQMDITVLDSMPYSGDKWGSTFSGGYTISNCQIDLDRLGSTLDTFKIYYTLDEQYRDKTIAEIGENVVKTWPTVPIESDGSINCGNVVPVAWAIEGILDGGKSLTMTIMLEQDNPQPGDVLCNMVSQGSLSVYATAYRTKRFIDGVTWYDANNDGERQMGEAVIPGVTVTLRNATDNSIVVNDLGETCKTVTDENGYYIFNALAAGDYYIEFSSGATILDSYKASPTTTDNTSDYLNSDLIPKYGEGSELIGGTTSTVSLPTKDKLVSYTYYIKNVDAGFSQSGTLTINKVVQGSGDKEASWSIEVQFSGPMYKDDMKFSYIGDQEGVIGSGDKVILKHDESITIENIPADTEYTVTQEEFNANGYVTSTFNTEGTIKGNENAEATIVDFLYNLVVRIPKVIVLSSSGEGSYSVGVKGEITDEQTVQIAPESSTFNLSESFVDDNAIDVKEDLMGTVHLSDTDWTNLDDLAEVGTDEFAFHDGNITVENPTAGSWKGSINFLIDVITNSVP